MVPVELTQTGVPVVLMIGQSNIARDPVAMSAAQDVSQSGGVALHHAVSGSPLDMSLDRGQGDWSASDDPEAGEHLIDLFVKMDAIFDPDSPTYIEGAYLAGAIWVQGEADSSSPVAAASYAQNVIDLRNAIANEYGEHDWVVAALSQDIWDIRDYGLKREENWVKVSEEQISLNDVPGFTTVAVDDVATENGFSMAEAFEDDFVHYNPDFGNILGTTLAQSLELDEQAGDNMVLGTSEKDVLVVEDETQSIVMGFSGNDTADFSNLQNAIKIEGADEKWVSVLSQNGQSDFSAVLDSVERLIGTDFADRIIMGRYLRDVRSGDGDDRVDGSSINDAIRLGDGNDIGRGMDGNDFLDGGWGDDRLSGGEGDDRLYGHVGNDRLWGGRGDDDLYGGRGDDIMSGNSGEDTFFVSRGNNGTDKIIGFNDREDTISFEKTAVTLEDLSVAVEGENLVLTFGTEKTYGEIVLRDAADSFWGGEDEDADETPDWLIFSA